MGESRRLYTRRALYGVGINDVSYAVTKKQFIDGKQKQVWKCPYYSCWQQMLRRCYSEEYLTKYPTYIGVTVCDEWLTFSNFRAWMETQDWEGKELDKDLLGTGKQYSPENCIFVTQELNKFLNTRRKPGKPLGAFLSKRKTRYEVMICDFDGISHFVGSSTDELEAHFIWLKYKIITMKKVIELQSDTRIMKRLTEILNDLEYCLQNRIEVCSILRPLVDKGD